MSKQYYFKSWEEAHYLMNHLDECGGKYEYEQGVNIVDDGYDHLVEVFDEYSRAIAQPIAELIFGYTYEQYELDKAEYVALGIDPRLVMSYRATLDYEIAQTELARYDELYEDEEPYMTDELDPVAAEVIEQDELIEFVEMAERTAMAERNVFGYVEFEPQFNWNAKSKPDERGWSRAVLDIVEDEGASIAESIFELY